MSKIRHGFIALPFILAGLAWSADNNNFLQPPYGTQPVAQMGGDTISEYSVSCDSFSLASLRPAVTNRSRRKMCFQNHGNQIISIGTAAVSSSMMFELGESTNSALSPSFCTQASPALYCQVAAGLAKQTVIVVEETQSNP